MGLFVCPKECYHAALERGLANPYTGVDLASVQIHPCGDACDFCSGKYGLIFPKVVRPGVKKALISLFLGSGTPIVDPILEGDEAFVKALQNYPDAQRLLFGSRAKSPPELREIKKVVVILFAAGILTYRISYAESDSEKKNPIVMARLASDDDGNLFVDDDERWRYIPTKPSPSQSSLDNRN